MHDACPDSGHSNAVNRRDYWDSVHARHDAGTASWTQTRPTVSLHLLAAAGLTPESRVIDIGAGDSLLVDEVISRGLTHLTVLDVSPVALERAKAGLGGLHVSWIAADVTGPWREPVVDFWHDRAVFHFLTDASDRERYVEHLRRSLTPGGTAVIAAFALDGPERCSGLPVVRYSPETLAAELGAEFEVEESVREQHVTPSGGVQPFIDARLRRRLPRT